MNRDRDENEQFRSGGVPYNMLTVPLKTTFVDQIPEKKCILICPFIIKQKYSLALTVRLAKHHTHWNRETPEKHLWFKIRMIKIHIFGQLDDYRQISENEIILKRKSNKLPTSGLPWSGTFIILLTSFFEYHIWFVLLLLFREWTDGMMHRNSVPENVTHNFRRKFFLTNFHFIYFFFVLKNS